MAKYLTQTGELRPSANWPLLDSLFIKGGVRCANQASTLNTDIPEDFRSPGMLVYLIKETAEQGSPVYYSWINNKWEYVPMGGGSGGSFIKVLELSEYEALVTNEEISDSVIYMVLSPRDIVSLPVVNAAGYTYGSPNIPVISSTDYYTVTGPASITSAGIYSYTLSLVDPINNCWSDNSSSDKVVLITINKVTVVFPSTIEKQYTGQPITASTTLYTITPDGKTNVGEYLVSVTLNDTLNYRWADTVATTPRTATLKIVEDSWTFKEEGTEFPIVFKE